MHKPAIISILFSGIFLFIQCGIPESVTVLDSPTISYDNTNTNRGFLYFDEPSSTTNIQGYVVHYRFYLDGDGAMDKHIEQTLNPDYYEEILLGESLDPGFSDYMKTAGYENKIVPYGSSGAISSENGKEMKSYFISKDDITGSRLYFVPDTGSDQSKIYASFDSGNTSIYCQVLRGVKDPKIPSYSLDEYRYLPFDSTDFYWDDGSGDADLGDLNLGTENPNQIYVGFVVYSVGLDSTSLSKIYSLPQHLGVLKISIHKTNTERILSNYN